MKGRSFCGVDHAGRPGSLDESARRLSHEELVAATQLAGEGHAVRSRPEGGQVGRTADLDVCGTAVEIKSWLSLADRGGRRPGPRSVLNKLLSGREQAQVVILNGRGSGLSGAAARAGLALYGARADRNRLASARVLGDGFDLSWSRSRQLTVAAGADRACRLDPGRTRALGY